MFFTFFSLSFLLYPHSRVFYHTITFLITFFFILSLSSLTHHTYTYSTLPNYLSWMPYISWIMYANEAMTIVQWQGVTNLSKIFNKIFVLFSQINIFCIACPITEDNLPCLQDGADVLAKYSFSDDNLARDIWALVILYIAFHTLGYIFLWRKTRRT